SSRIPMRVDGPSPARSESPSDGGFRLIVRLPELLRDGHGDTLVIHERVTTIAELVQLLEERLPPFSESRDELFNFAINGEMLLHGEDSASLANGDEVEIVVAFSGG
ncbi:MAG TPA: MoaD/ThiS family protein, partial [Thermoanaerobaculia bacterium]|nr:MoaD/ThiS family protein [Thermoanaerobaculia bacterium]